MRRDRTQIYREGRPWGDTAKVSVCKLSRDTSQETNWPTPWLQNSRLRGCGKIHVCCLSPCSPSRLICRVRSLNHGPDPILSGSDYPPGEGITRGIHSTGCKPGVPRQTSRALSSALRLRRLAIPSLILEDICSRRPKISSLPSLFQLCRNSATSCPLQMYARATTGDKDAKKILKRKM